MSIAFYVGMSFSMRNLSIKVRIIFGFGITIGLLFLMVLLVENGNRQAEQNISAYDELSNLVEIISEVDRKVLQLQKMVLIYSSSGHESSVRQAHKIRTELEHLFQELNAYEQINQHEVVYQKMLDLKTRYFEVYDRAVEDRQRRVLLMDKLIISGVDSPKHIGENVKLNQSLVHFLHADQHAMRFGMNPDSTEVELAKRHLHQAEQYLIEQKVSESDPGNLLLKKTNEYRNDFLQMVQSTRGYLFLFNVVMAGQSAEFTRQSNDLRKMVLKEQAELLKQFKRRAQDLRIANFSIAAVALLVGLGVAWYIGRGIANPIKSMTLTLNALAKGDQAAEIPMSGYKDELGQMAAAAQVFKEKNQQTEALLEQSLATETRLKEQTSNLERANAELEQFAYVASHDLQEPLRMVASYVQLLAEEYGDSINEEAHEFIGFAAEGAKRMQVLINDLLSLSRVGRSDAQIELVDLEEAYRVAFSAVQHRLDDVNHAIEIGALPEVRGFEHLIVQVIQNFLTNAIKYRKPDGKLEINISVEESADMWILRCRDNGIGIEAAHTQKIFKIFQRLHSRNKFEGSGVGLAIVQKIANQHEGYVWVESEPGVGSTFFFSMRKDL